MRCGKWERVAIPPSYDTPPDVHVYGPEVYREVPSDALRDPHEGLMGADEGLGLALVDGPGDATSSQLEFSIARESQMRRG